MALSTTFGAFRRRLNIRGTSICTNVQKKIRRAAIKADEVVVIETPVDTGRAKTNWIVSLGTPVFEELPSSSPGTKGSTQAEVTSNAINDGRSIVGQYRLSDGSIFITNSLPYIQALEDGSSMQSPEGMVKQAVLAAQIEFRKGKVFGL